MRNTHITNTQLAFGRITAPTTITTHLKKFMHSTCLALLRFALIWFHYKCRTRTTTVIKNKSRNRILKYDTDATNHIYKNKTNMKLKHKHKEKHYKRTHTPIRTYLLRQLSSFISHVCRDNRSRSREYMRNLDSIKWNICHFYFVIITSYLLGVHTFCDYSALLIIFICWFV